jgi:hypothetical protein
MTRHSDGSLNGAMGPQGTDMKWHATIIATAMVALCALPADGQTTVSRGDMPSASQVEAAVTGTDPMDTAARRMGAFWQLQGVVKTVAGVRQYRNQLTAEERRLIGEYSAGYQRAAQPYAHIQNSPSHPDKPRWYQMHAGYEVDEGLRNALLDGLCSPALRAAYRRAKGEQDARSLARSQEAERIRAQGGVQIFGDPQQGQADPSPVEIGEAIARGVLEGTAGPPPTRPADPNAIDPSIAKARAAKVDTKVFGIPLGEPLNLPVCDPLAGLDNIGAPCLFQVPFQGLAESLLGSLAPKQDPNQVTIKLPKASCPQWAARCEFTGTLHEGLLVGIAIPTTGRFVEKAVLRELRGKYGTPTGFYVHTITPNAGEPYKTDNPEWAGLPGLYVFYTVVGAGTEGVLATAEGVVRIETESAYRRREAEEQEAAKPRL